MRMFGNRLLVLVPHPDDEVVGVCAGITRARANGSSVFGAYLTNGVPAKELHWPWQRSEVAVRVQRRWRESETVAAALGIVPAWRQDTPTRTLKSFIKQTIAAIREVINRYNVDTIWTPAYEGGHQDHDTANFIASRFSSQVRVWEFSEYNFACGKVRKQQFPHETGHEIVLTLDEREQSFKHRMYAVYASEQGTLRHMGLRTESFRPLKTYDYTRRPHAGRLYYQRLQWIPFQPRIDYCRPEDICRAFKDYHAASGGSTG